MNILAAIQYLILFVAPINVEEAAIEQSGFRVEVYPYGGYYSYPPCPPGYAYRYGYCYRSGFQFYYGPGYYGRRYHRGRPYRHYRRHHRQHRGRRHRGRR